MMDSRQLEAYRARTFRLDETMRLRTIEEAIDLVNERGFVYFWPIKGILFPSLWAAVAGMRQVAEKHDDPGHITWGWKDQMLGQRKWHYAKVLRGKATMISLALLPSFYALSENYGDLEQDYQQLYEDGLLSREAKLVYEALLREGPLHTVALRQKTGMSGEKSNSPFERGLTLLQREFRILPVGIAEAGAWRYSFIYDAVHRYYPELLERAREISRSAARRRLAECYFRSVGAATAADVQKLFQWPRRDVQRTVEGLVDAGFLQMVGLGEKEPAYILSDDVL
jgi:hypothetical protein